MKKLLTALVALSMVFTLSLPLSAGAQTLAELQAQINSLLSIIAKLQIQLASIQGGTAQSFVFTNNLTVGSTGNQVRELQMFLVSRNFLVMPAGVPFGYFGPLTQNALARFQASQGISPAVGFFGPITMARVNAILAQNQPVPPSSGGGVITTPGVEGIVSVASSNAGLRSTLYEGDQMVPILGMRITARLSDVAVQRVKVNLGNDTRLYNRILSRLYVTDGNNVLASLNLNSGTVTKEGNTYYATITGFNYIVPRNADRNLVVKADAYPTIDSTYINTTFTIQLADNGIRAIDGANIDHLFPASGSVISRNIVAQQSLSESAALRISLNSSSPMRQEVIADSGVVGGELDKLSVLIFNANATRDEVTITDLQVNVVKSGSGGAQISTLYLYDGNTEIDNTSVIGSTATFQNVDYALPEGATRALTIKADVRGANASLANFVVSIPSSGIIAENSVGDQLSSGSINGSATGYEIGIRNRGPEITLVSKSTNVSGVPQDNDSTSLMTAQFSIRVRAIGGDVIFGTPASTSPMFDTDSFKVYRNGVVTPITSASISFNAPAGSITSGLSNSFMVTENNEVVIPVTFQITGRDGGSAITSGLYSIGLENVNWVSGGSAQQTTFMAGDTAWRTNDVSFP